MTQDKSKKEDYDEIQQKVYDAMDEVFEDAENEVSNILKKYIGSPNSKDKENDSGEEHEYIATIKRKPSKRNR